MLATSICLEQCMKKDLLSTFRDAIKKDWLARWKERLGNLDVTPRQFMRAYVKNLDITVAHLDGEMEHPTTEFSGMEGCQSAGH
jgi:hypothetical protein